MSLRAIANDVRRAKSPYTISLPMQVRLCIRRGYQRLRGDMGILITGVIFNAVMALVIGSVFYNLPNDTGHLYSRGALLFFAILLAAFSSALEARLPSTEYRALLTVVDSGSLCATPNRREAIEVRICASFCRIYRSVRGHCLAHFNANDE